MAKKTKVDVKVLNGGTLWQFFLLSDEAKEWTEENVRIADYMRLGTCAFACEHRCGPDLVEGMRGSGLKVAGGC